MEKPGEVFGFVVFVFVVVFRLGIVVVGVVPGVPAVPVVPVVVVGFTCAKMAIPQVKKMAKGFVTGISDLSPAGLYLPVSMTQCEFRRTGGTVLNVMQP